MSLVTLREANCQLAFLLEDPEKLDIPSIEADRIVKVGEAHQATLPAFSEQVDTAYLDADEKEEQILISSESASQLHIFCDPVPSLSVSEILNKKTVELAQEKQYNPKTQATNNHTDVKKKDKNSRKGKQWSKSVKKEKFANLLTYFHRAKSDEELLVETSESYLKLLTKDEIELLREWEQMEQRENREILYEEIFMYMMKKRETENGFKATTFDFNLLVVPNLKIARVIRETVEKPAKETSMASSKEDCHFANISKKEKVSEKEIETFYQHYKTIFAVQNCSQYKRQDSFQNMEREELGTSSVAVNDFDKSIKRSLILSFLKHGTEFTMVAKDVGISSDDVAKFFDCFKQFFFFNFLGNKKRKIMYTNYSLEILRKEGLLEEFERSRRTNEEINHEIVSSYLKYGRNHEMVAKDVHIPLTDVMIFYNRYSEFINSEIEKSPVPFQSGNQKEHTEHKENASDKAKDLDSNDKRDIILLLCKYGGNIAKVAKELKLPESDVRQIYDQFKTIFYNDYLDDERRKREYEYFVNRQREERAEQNSVNHLSEEVGVEDEEVFDEAEEVFDEAEEGFDEDEKVFDEAEEVFDEAEEGFDEDEEIFDEAEKVFDEDEEVFDEVGIIHNKFEEGFAKSEEAEKTADTIEEISEMAQAFSDNLQITEQEEKNRLP